MWFLQRYHPVLPHSKQKGKQHSIFPLRKYYLMEVFIMRWYLLRWMVMSVVKDWNYRRIETVTKKKIHFVLEMVMITQHRAHITSHHIEFKVGVLFCHQFRFECDISICLDSQRAYKIRHTAIFHARINEGMGVFCTHANKHTTSSIFPFLFLSFFLYWDGPVAIFMLLSFFFRCANVVCIWCLWILCAWDI